MFVPLEELLASMEHEIDPEREKEIEELHRLSVSYQPVPRLPLVMNYPVGEGARFEPLPHGRVYESAEYMLYNELVSAFEASIAYKYEMSDDLPITIRPNFGTVLVASILGGRVEQVDDHRPWVRPFETDRDFFRIFDADAESRDAGWLPRVVETYQRYDELLSPYPRFRACIRTVLPDLQGPLDILAQLRGEKLFTDFYTDPTVVDDGIALVSRTLRAVFMHLSPFTVDGPQGFTHQHAMMIAGNILIRDDSAVMISPHMYERHILAADAALLETAGGGGIHACGRIEHDFDLFLSIPHLRCIDLGQPEMNDIDSLYREAAPRKVALIRMRVPESKILDASVLRRFPTGVSLVHAARSRDDAKRIMDSYRDAAARGE